MWRAEGTDRSDRRVPMDDGINPYEYRDADCSGRSLASLVIAWIGAALVASVLLQWTYMWVALAVLTFLFLLACGYSACDARRAHERALAREQERQLRRRQRRERELATVSRGIDNYPEVIDPPEYQTYWIADLPPSYATVATTRPIANGSSQSPSSPDEDQTPAAPRLSNPPPYSVAVLSEPVILHGANGQTGGDNDHAGQTGSPQARDEDKVDDEPAQSTNVLTTGTQYLASIINSTFGRGPRRANVDQNVAQAHGNVERASNSNADMQNNRNREQSVANNDRNHMNSNAVVGPPPQYSTQLQD